MRHAMIMAGGSGTRLWPVSRGGLPKQLVPLIGGAVAGAAAVANVIARIIRRLKPPVVMMP